MGGEHVPGSDAERGDDGPDVRPLAERSAPVDGRQPDPSRSLPEIRVRHIGLHVGGGPNDDETRHPILRAFEAHTERFLRCYRQVDHPLRGGIYGVDLYVAARGGTPEVRATRQKLGPEAFDACMMDAFREVRLPPPPRATVVSYSLRFDVLDGADE